MAKDTSPNRLPRGTKVVARAFFDAAGGFPEANRPAVIKAALAAIRDELKAVREKAAAAKARAKQPATKMAAEASGQSGGGKPAAAKSKKAAPEAPAPVPVKAKKKAAANRRPLKFTKASPAADSQAGAEAAGAAEVPAPEVVVDAEA